MIETVVYIASIYIRDFKKIKAFFFEVTPETPQLVVIGGKNKQGKTSIFDAVAWAFGGAKYEPSNPHRDGAMNDPAIAITMSNGIVVTRKGKNGTLVVTDPKGLKGGQSLLNEFVSQLALDLSKFMSASNKEKANILLDLLGVKDVLAKLDETITRLYNERLAHGQVADQKKKYADELPEYADAPAEPVSIIELIQQQQKILTKNGENQRKREQTEQLRFNLAGCANRMNEVTEQIRKLEELRESLLQQHTQIQADLLIAEKTVSELQDESTAELETSIANIESINLQVSANMQKARALDEAEEYKGKYDEYTAEIEKVRAERMALLDGANMPLPGLTVEEQVLKYNGQEWDGMSGAEQLKVATAIARALSPKCGFVLIDKLEAMDEDTLREFGEWAEQVNLQIIATRVSTGPECCIVLEDGLPKGATYIDITTGISVPAVQQEPASPPTMEF